jgi:hypothetical protein
MAKSVWLKRIISSSFRICDHIALPSRFSTEGAQSLGSFE